MNLDMFWQSIMIVGLLAGAIWMILDSITDVRADLSNEIADVGANLGSRISDLEEKLDLLIETLDIRVETADR